MKAVCWQSSDGVSEAGSKIKSIPIDSNSMYSPHQLHSIEKIGTRSGLASFDSFPLCKKFFLSLINIQCFSARVEGVGALAGGPTQALVFSRCLPGLTTYKNWNGPLHLFMLLVLFGTLQCNYLTNNLVFCLSPNMLASEILVFYVITITAVTWH